MSTRKVHPKVGRARGQLGSLIRRQADPDAIAAVRRRLAEAKLEDQVQRAVSDAPPLSPEVVDNILAIVEHAMADSAPSSMGEGVNDA